MQCSNCSHQLNPHQTGNIVYWACKECHTLWFDNKENDFLTLEEVQDIHSHYPAKELKHKAYNCLRCDKPMNKEKGYFYCYLCGGTLITSDQLLQQKESQVSKFASTNKGFSATNLRSVVVMGALVLFLALNYGIISNLNKKTTIESQAAEIDQHIRVQEVNDKQIAVFFTTTELYKTEAVIKKQTIDGGVTTEIKPISVEPSLAHFVLIDKPASSTKTELTIQFIPGDSQKNQHMITSKTIDLAHLVN